MPNVTRVYSGGSHLVIYRPVTRVTEVIAIARVIKCQKSSPSMRIDVVFVLFGTQDAHNLVVTLASRYWEWGEPTLAREHGSQGAVERCFLIVVTASTLVHRYKECAVASRLSWSSSSAINDRPSPEGWLRGSATRLNRLPVLPLPLERYPCNENISSSIPDLSNRSVIEYQRRRGSGQEYITGASNRQHHESAPPHQKSVAVHYG